MTAIALPEAIKGYVGIPFANFGRDRRACDCWGLVRLIHLDHGIDLPLHDGISATELLKVARQVNRAARSKIWVDVGDRSRRAFDCVLMKRDLSLSKKAWHLGIMVDDRRVLHTEPGVDSHIVPLGDNSLRDRVIGFRRHWSIA